MRTGGAVVIRSWSKHWIGTRGANVEEGSQDEESMPDCSSETVDKLDRLDGHPKQSDQQSQ